MKDDLILAARRARDLAQTLISPEAKRVFLRLAEKWEAEAAKAPHSSDSEQHQRERQKRRN